MACWWQQLVGPLRLVWLSLSSRLHIKRHRNGDGLLKLHDDVQTCEYQDVQVMWEMLRRTELELAPDHLKRKRHPSWRILVSSSLNRSSSAAASFSAKTATKEPHNNI